MALAIELRNAKTLKDLQKQETEYFRLLKLRSKLNRQYQQAFDDMAQNKKIDVTELAPQRRTVQEELADVVLQRQIAFDNLKSIMTPVEAEKTLSRLSDNQLRLINSNMKRIVDELKGRTNITDTFFMAFLNRFQEMLNKTLSRVGDDGKIIPTGLLLPYEDKTQEELEEEARDQEEIDPIPLTPEALAANADTIEEKLRVDYGDRLGDELAQLKAFYAYVGRGEGTEEIPDPEKEAQFTQALQRLQSILVSGATKTDKQKYIESILDPLTTGLEQYDELVRTATQARDDIYNLEQADAYGENRLNERQREDIRDVSDISQRFVLTPVAVQQLDTISRLLNEFTNLADPMQLQFDPRSTRGYRAAIRKAQTQRIKRTGRALTKALQDTLAYYQNRPRPQRQQEEGQQGGEEGLYEGDEQQQFETPHKKGRSPPRGQRSQQEQLAMVPYQQGRSGITEQQLEEAFSQVPFGSMGQAMMHMVEPLTRGNPLVRGLRSMFDRSSRTQLPISSDRRPFPALPNPVPEEGATMTMGLQQRGEEEAFIAQKKFIEENLWKTEQQLEEELEAETDPTRQEMLARILTMKQRGYDLPEPEQPPKKVSPKKVSKPNNARDVTKYLIEKRSQLPREAQGITLPWKKGESVPLPEFLDRLAVAYNEVADATIQKWQKELAKALGVDFGNPQLGQTEKTLKQRDVVEDYGRKAMEILGEVAEAPAPASTTTKVKRSTATSKPTLTDVFEGIARGELPSGTVYTAYMPEQQQPQTGKGIHHKTKTKIIGRGILVEPQERYQHFGRYLIHMPSLKQHVINIRFPSKIQHNKISPKQVSQDFVDIIHTILKDHVVRPRDIERLSASEKQFFYKILKESHVNEALGIDIPRDSEYEEDLKRFELIRGELIAGNNAKELLDELKGFILKFMSDGRLKKHQAMEILAELSLLQ